MKQMQRKCSLIDWRDKVEEIYEKIQKEERLTLEAVVAILDEGCEKGFVNKDKVTGYSAQEVASDDPVNVLLLNFKSFGVLIKITEEAKAYNKELKKVLAKVSTSKESPSSSSGEENSSS